MHSTRHCGAEAGECRRTLVLTARSTPCMLAAHSGNRANGNSGVASTSAAAALAASQTSNTVHAVESRLRSRQMHGSALRAGTESKKRKGRDVAARLSCASCAAVQAGTNLTYCRGERCEGSDAARPRRNATGLHCAIFQNCGAIRAPAVAHLLQKIAES